MQIYKITNNINSKIYIGKDTKNNEKYFGSGILIKRSIKKYGIENFSKDILEECDNYDELNRNEIKWISYFNSTNKNIGYNITSGGDGGDTFTNNPNKDEYSNNKSETFKKLWKNKTYRNNVIKSKTGLKRTEETKKKMSNSSKNKPKSDSHKKSLSKAWDKRKIEHPYMIETLEKMSKSMLGKNAKNKYRLINPVGIIFITNNLTQFAKENNLQRSILSKVISGERKHHKQWKCEKINE